jgi:cell division protein FtsB
MRRKPRWGPYIFLWLLVASAFAGLAVVQYSRYDNYARELERLRASIEQERRTASDIEYQRAFYDSDAYVEQLAREWLGFVRPDEIVFVNTE